MISGIVLAAGESQRMGSPKALKKINGRTFLWHIVHQLTLADLTDIHVVLGSKSSLIKSQCGVSGVDFVVNENFQLGQFSSLQCGVNSLSEEVIAVVVCLVDQPHIQSKWIRELLSAYENSGGKIIVPMYTSRRGHPVLYDAQVLEEITKMDPTESAKSLMTKYTNDLIEIDIADAGLLTDVDTPQDLPKILSYFQL